MKRWNWPTTILYIKHKKANLKQRCSKLVGNKRKAPSEGWSGGLNCPFGTGEEMHWHVPLGASGAGPRHYPGTAQGTRPGGARTDPNGPGAAEMGTVYEVIPRREMTGQPKSRRAGSPRNPQHSSSPGLHCPTLPLPPRAAHRGAQRKATRVLQTRLLNQIRAR